MPSEWLWAIHHEGPMSQLTAHNHNRIQGEWEWLSRATALHGQSIKDQHNHVVDEEFLLKPATFIIMSFYSSFSPPFMLRCRFFSPQKGAFSVTVPRAETC